MLLVAGAMVAVAAVVLSALLIASIRDSDGAGVVHLDDAALAIPDLVVTIAAAESADGETAEAEGRALAARLVDSPTIAWAALDQREGPTAAVLVGAVADLDVESAARRAVLTEISQRPSPARFSVAGRLEVDTKLDTRIGTGWFIAVALATLLLAALVTFVFDPIRGLISGAALALGAGFAGAIGASVAGGFDGSLATTPIPAALAGIAAGGYAIVSLLRWFADPEGEDEAELIRRSVASVVPELALTLGALFAAALAAEAVGLVRSVGLGLAVGGGASALFALAVLPPLFATLNRIRPLDPDVPQSLAVQLPKGRELPFVAVAAVGLGLVALGAFAFGPTSDDQLFDSHSLGVDDPTAAKTDAMIESGGDPTAAIFALFPVGADQTAKTAWLEGVSIVGAVDRVDTAAGRYVDGQFTEAEGLLGPPELVAADADETPRFALIVPEATGRSGAAVGLLDGIDALDEGIEVELAGIPVETVEVNGRDRSDVLLTIAAIAIAGGLAVSAIVADIKLVALSTVIRLVGLAAVTGLYLLLASDPSGAEIQLTLFAISVPTMLFEIGMLRMLAARHQTEETEGLLDTAIDTAGIAAGFALCLAMVGSLGLFATDLIVVRRFALLFVIAGILKVATGMWLLRPVLLGRRAVRSFAAGPVRRALDSLTGSSVESPAEHRAWVTVVDRLLATEFNFQANPAVADASTVYVPDTPAFRKAVDHNLSLVDAGLRVIGPPPQLRALRVLDNAAPASLVVTIDHPPRQLIDGESKTVGIRRPERRSAMLWMLMQADGTYRIVDTVELGAAELAAENGAITLDHPEAATPTPTHV